MESRVAAGITTLNTPVNASFAAEAPAPGLDGAEQFVGASGAEWAAVPVANVYANLVGRRHYERTAVVARQNGKAASKDGISEQCSLAASAG